MTTYLDFEKPLAEIEGKAEELRAMARQNKGMDIEREAKDGLDEAAALDRKAADMLRDLYKGLTPWQKCQVARHPERPHCRDYVAALFTEWTPLAGDRNFADDQAVMGGLARLDDRPIVVIGHEKGHDTRTRIEHNFGMARPEGYRIVYAEYGEGDYERAFTLSQDIDEAKISAEIKNGVLSLRLPRAEATKPRRIEVKPA